MRIFIISDTHFGHKALAAEYLSRPDNFTSKTIENWTKLVKQNDIIIHLGDVVVGGPKTWEETVSILPGRKILVTGNHDQKTFSWYMANGFEFCCTCFMWNLFGFDIAFSHEPIFTGKFDLNIHGHLHLERHREIKTDSRHYLFSLEKTVYQPLLLDTIVKEWKKASQNFYKAH